MPVLGSGFEVLAGPVYSCRLVTADGKSISTTPVAATSTESIICMTKPWPYTDMSPRFQLLRSGKPVYYSGNTTMRFQYLAQPTDTWQAASPQRGMATGGQLVTISGAGFNPKITYQCKFTSTTNTSWIAFSGTYKPRTNEQFVCVVPRWVYAAGQVTTTVLQAGRLVKFATVDGGGGAQQGDGVLFTFLASIDEIFADNFAKTACTVDSEPPRREPGGQCISGSMSGGQRIRITGAGFSSTEEINCVFATLESSSKETVITSPATITNPNELRCSTPNWANADLLSKVYLEMGADLINEPGKLYFEFVPDLQNNVKVTMLDSE